MGLALCWGIAAVAVFLPILHLVLVPSFVVAGIAVAVALGRQTERVVGIRGPCPRCGSTEQFEAGGKLRRERIVACPRCHTNLTLVVTEGQRAREMAVDRT
jgi:transposase-like protein